MATLQLQHTYLKYVTCHIIDHVKWVLMIPNLTGLSCTWFITINKLKKTTHIEITVHESLACPSMFARFWVTAKPPRHAHTLASFFFLSSILFRFFLALLLDTLPHSLDLYFDLCTWICLSLPLPEHMAADMRCSEFNLEREEHMPHHWICTQQLSRWCLHIPFRERVPLDIHVYSFQTVECNAQLRFCVHPSRHYTGGDFLPRCA